METEFDDDDGGQGSGIEEEEEPLFADDLSDDELPPLPPPLPPLPDSSSQGPVSGGGGGARGSSGGGTTGDPSATQANDQAPPLKKRKPLLTLTVDKIFTEKGLPYLESEFPKLQFKGKGHEVADLQFLMKQYEHWANRLFPKYTFKDVTQRIERLSTTKEFKNRLHSIRRMHARGGQATPPLVDSDDEMSTNTQTNGVVSGAPPPVINGDRPSTSPDPPERVSTSPDPLERVSTSPDPPERVSNSPDPPESGPGSPWRRNTFPDPLDSEDRLSTFPDSAGARVQNGSSDCDRVPGDHGDSVGLLNSLNSQWQSLQQSLSDEQFLEQMADSPFSMNDVEEINGERRLESGDEGAEIHGPDSGVNGKGSRHESDREFSSDEEPLDSCPLVIDDHNLSGTETNTELT